MAENTELAAQKPEAGALVRQDIPIGPDGMNFANIEAVYRFGQYAISSAMFPQFKHPNQIVIVYQISRDTGISLTMALQYVCFINNRASMWGDGLLAAVLNTGRVEDVKEEMTGKLSDGTLAWTCTILKKGQPSPIVRTFEWADAVTAGLSGKDTYKKWPKRMIQMRARAWALRDTGLTGGVGSAEEEEDREFVESRVVASRPVNRAQIDVGATLGRATETTSAPGGTAEEAPKPRPEAKRPEKRAESAQAVPDPEPALEPDEERIPFGNEPVNEEPDPLAGADDPIASSPASKALAARLAAEAGDAPLPQPEEELFDEPARPGRKK